MRGPFRARGPAQPPARPVELPGDAQELRGAGFLLLDDGHCFRDQALAYCASARGRELDFRATSLATLAQMVAGGAGITLLPRLSLPVENRRSELAVRRIASPSPRRTLALVWRPRSPLGPALRRLATTIREACAGAEPRLEAAVGGKAPVRSRGGAGRKGAP